ncbi:MAG TPA: class I SAM-dependent methyltransferase [Gaiellaceae bacterium]|nr:class I SAM-dependent methyltransferase [Gaiellaceae bacterium]
MARPASMTRRPWNHNLHYLPVLLAAAPPGCNRALDVGCGEGILARELQKTIPHVTGIDLDETTLAKAKSQDCDVDYVLGDFLTHPFEPGSFDLVVSVAALHHMEPERTLVRMTDLLRPGGVLAILGLARDRYPADLARSVLATVVSRAYRLRHTAWESTAPTIWPPAHTYAEIRSTAASLLPGMHFRRHLLWYSIVWTKPVRA